MAESLALVIKNELPELTRVAGAIDEFVAARGLPARLAFELNLVLEEVLTNIISYGYEDASPHTIKIRAAREGEWISLAVEDDGRTFDPLVAVEKEPDLTASIEDRPIGGLGIFLVKKLMDELEYRRQNKNNLLSMKKRIPSQ
jgi:anti-sigma regulatory factor (Ser/Thr protein kinase)